MTLGNNLSSRAAAKTTGYASIFSDASCFSIEVLLHFVT